MFGLGWPELLFIILIGLLLFGANKLPDIAKSLGKAVFEFKKGMSGEEADKSPGNEPPKDRK